MSKIKLIMTCGGKPNKELLKKFDSNYDVSQITDNKGEEALISAIKTADVVYLGGDDYFSKNVLENAPKLKLLAFGGTGYESYIDKKVATDLGIGITNTPEANSDTVAEFAIGLLLSLQRNITMTNNLVKKGVWNRLVSREVKSQEVGIIGMGAIASRITKILVNGFGANVSYYNRTRVKSIEGELGVTYKSKEDLLKDSDVVFIAITENESTWNFIDKKELNLMKSTAVLIDPARPKLINPKALFDALKNNKISGCAMDGYYSEADKDEYGLLALDDSTFISTSYIACRTTDAWNKTDEIAFESIKEIFETGNSSKIVNPEFEKNKK